MSDKAWNPEVERIRKAMMERFSDKLSMEEIAEFAYSLAGECRAPAPQLKEILTKYGAHHIRDCAALNKWKKLPCDCGFATLIRGTSEQAPQELELEQEADGRWLAEFLRFAGVMAYGKSPEEAIRNAAKVLIEPCDHFWRTIPVNPRWSWFTECEKCKIGAPLELQAENYVEGSSPGTTKGNTKD